MSELSPQDIKRIAKHFLLSSPAGEMEDVLTDVRALVNDDALLTEAAADIFRTYNIEQLTPVDVPGSEYKLVLCKYGEVDATHYKDPRTGKIVTVDHMKAIVTDVQDGPAENPAVTAKRESLQAALDDYLYNHYHVGSANVFAGNDNGSELIVVISSSKFSHNNFWSGRWRSVYRVTYLADNKVKLSGTMKVNIHYFEEGNVQLNTSQEHGETIEAASAAAVGAEVVKVIKKAESNFQAKIEESCSSLSSTTFKALRRKLPVTAEPMNFASAAHKLAGEITRK